MLRTLIKKEIHYLLITMLVWLLFCDVVDDYAAKSRAKDCTSVITVTMEYGKEAVPGGSLTIYQAGRVCREGGKTSYQPTELFAGWPGRLESVQSAGLAESLAAYVQEHALPGTTREIGQEGRISFGGLEEGLYLLIQNEAAAGYQKAEPFLVTVPIQKDGTYIYEVDAGPKVELEREPQSDPAPSDTRLPQTGQKNLLVLLLCAGGLILTAAGWLLKRGRDTRNTDIF